MLKISNMLMETRVLVLTLRPLSLQSKICLQCWRIMFLNKRWFLQRSMGRKPSIPWTMEVCQLRKRRFLQLRLLMKRFLWPRWLMKHLMILRLFVKLTPKLRKC